MVELLEQVITEVRCLHRGRIVALRLFVLGAAPAGVKPVQQDLFPVDLVLVLLLTSLLVDAHIFLDVGFAHLQEGILRELLLQMGLEIQEGHVEQLHRLIEARVDLHLLSEFRALIEPVAEAAHSVGVGGS